jgi:nicotinamidase-related amidase
VESTLRDAYFRDYRCLLLIELVYGWVADSAALVRALTERPIAVGVE